MRPYLSLSVLCVAALFLCGAPVWAVEECHLSGMALLWTPNTEPDLKEYQLFVNTQPDVQGDGGQIVIIPLSPIAEGDSGRDVVFRYPITFNMASGPAYFGLRAMDTSQNVSAMTPVLHCQVVQGSFQVDLHITPQISQGE